LINRRAAPLKLGRAAFHRGAADRLKPMTNPPGAAAEPFGAGALDDLLNQIDGRRVIPIVDPGLLAVAAETGSTSRKGRTRLAA
jgi:hypothetical protein